MDSPWAGVEVVGGVAVGGVGLRPTTVKRVGGVTVSVTVDGMSAEEVFPLATVVGGSPESYYWPKKAALSTW